MNRAIAGPCMGPLLAGVSLLAGEWTIVVDERIDNDHQQWSAIIIHHQPCLTITLQESSILILTSGKPSWAMNQPLIKRPIMIHQFSIIKPIKDYRPSIHQLSLNSPWIHHESTNTWIRSAIPQIHHFPLVHQYHEFTNINQSWTYHSPWTNPSCGCFSK